MGGSEDSDLTKGPWKQQARCLTLVRTATRNCRILESILPLLQEDELLVELIEKHGTGNWSVIAKEMPGRNGKSCRLRYIQISFPRMRCDGSQAPAVCCTFA